MNEALKLLHIEDDATDAELCEYELRRAGINFTTLRVSTRRGLEEALERYTPDLVLSDFNLRSDLDGLLALEIVRQPLPDTPFILVSGTIGEERAVNAMRAGATDYVLKDRIDRLGPVVKRALVEAAEKQSRVATEHALHQSELRFRLFMQNLPGRASIKDADGRFVYVNDTWCEAFGLKLEEVLGRRFEELWPGERAARLRQAHEAVLATGKSVSRVFSIGEQAHARWWLTHQFPIPWGDAIHVGTIGVDVTQQKIQEERVARLSRVQAMLSGINTAIIHTHDEQKLFEAACRIAIEHGRFGIVWVGRYDPAASTLTPAATGGLNDNDTFLSSAPLGMDAGTPEPMGVAAGAIRRRVPVHVNDMAADPIAGGERRREAVRRGYRSVIALPLSVDDEVVAVFSLFAREANFFDDEEIALLNELSANISYALGHIARQRKFDKLSRIRAVSGEINAAIVRVKDREALLRETCRIVAEHGGFEFVWTGLIDEDRKVVRPIAWAGFSDETASAVGMNIADPRVSLNELLRTHRPAVRNDVGARAGAGAGLLRMEALAKGCRSSVSLPFIADDKVVAALTIYAAGRGFFDQDELALLNELTADISYAFQSFARQEQVHYLSNYDPLTGLPNRQLFLDRVSQQIRSADGESRMVGLVVFEIERFRAINETLGRGGGDALLKQIAARSESTFGKDGLARVAGDTFAMVLPGIRDAAEVANAVQRRLAVCFNRPFAIDGNELRAAARAGIALYPADGDDAGVLFTHAEAALKRALSAGERYLFYTSEMNAHVAHSILLETKLRTAVDLEQFVLHYQPQIDLSTGRVCGLEALIRWRDPEKGLVPPGYFIPLLEETGLILQAGSWALGQAMRDHRAWSARGIEVPRIAVNVSALQLQQKDFVETVTRIVEEAGNEPGALEIEVTESLFMHDLESSVRKLAALRERGVQVAMDDFGTGYSSLSNIARLPIDLLKVDRSFVDGIASEAQHVAIVRTIIALAQSLSLRTIAEGVETQEQAHLLRLLRCDEAQGYYYSKPLPGEALVAFLASHKAEK